MKVEITQSHSIDEIENMYEESLREQYADSIYEEVKGITEKTIELAKKAMDETFEKHPEECKELVKIMAKYEDLILDDKKIQLEKFEELDCLYSKLNEINDTLYDIFFLLISAKYKTTRILLKKWIELIVFSIYYDTKEKDEMKKQRWIEVEQIIPYDFTEKLKKISDKPDTKTIGDLYRKLSLYAHNEGEKFLFLLPVYDDKQFNEVYSIINQLQLLTEKMIETNYMGKIKFNR